MTDSEFFKDSHHTWPEGYTAMRKFISLKGKLFVISCFSILIRQFLVLVD